MRCGQLLDALSCLVELELAADPACASEVGGDHQSIMDTYGVLQALCYQAAPVEPSEQ